MQLQTSIIGYDSRGVTLQSPFLLAVLLYLGAFHADGWCKLSDSRKVVGAPSPILGIPAAADGLRAKRSGPAGDIIFAGRASAIAAGFDGMRQ